MYTVVRKVVKVLPVNRLANEYLPTGFQKFKVCQAKGVRVRVNRCTCSRFCFQWVDL